MTRRELALAIAARVIGTLPFEFWTREFERGADAVLDVLQETAHDFCRTATGPTGATEFRDMPTLPRAQPHSRLL